MEHIIILRTYNSTELLQRSVESFILGIKNTKIKSIHFIVFDNSTNKDIISANIKYLNLLNELNVYYINSRSPDINGFIGFIYKNLDRALIGKFTSFFKLPNFDKLKTVESLDGISGTGISHYFARLAGIAYAKSMKLNLLNCIFTFPDDDVIYRTIESKPNQTPHEVIYDFIGARETLFKKGALFTTGKYLFHHGNVWVSLERDLLGISNALESYYILDNKFQKTNQFVFLNEKYQIPTGKEYIDLIPTIYQYMLKRSSIINPILPDHFLHYDKTKLTHDMGHYSVRGDLLHRYGIPSTLVEPFLQKIMLLVEDNFSKKIGIEPGIVHRRPVNKRINDHQKDLNLSSYLANIYFSITDSISAAINANPRYWTAEFSSIYNKNINEKLLSETFTYVPKRDINRIELILKLLDRIETIILRYGEYIPENTKSTLHMLLKMRDIDYIGSTANVEDGRKFLESFMVNQLLWNKLVLLDWDKFTFIPINTLKK